MKLTCDICNSDLQMSADGQSAVCVNCGVAYPIERLREKLNNYNTANVQYSNEQYQNNQYYSDQNYQPQNAYMPAEEPVQYLRIKRKIDLYVNKYAVIIDGQQKYILEGQGKETVIPITQGPHTIIVQSAGAGGIINLGELGFVVNNRDWYGEIWLARGAFRAKEKFQMWELT